MITSNPNPRATLFYFNKVEQLRDFESFKICPLHAGRHIPASEAKNADYWRVIGNYKAEQAIANQSPSFPVADLPTELYATLFAQMCHRFISDVNDDTLPIMLQKQAV